MTLVDVLTAARDRIQRDGKHSTRGPYTEDGCACSIMAILRACPDGGVGRLGWDGVALLAQAAGVPYVEALFGTRDLINWNDAHTTPEVLSVFDRAIALASESKP